MKGGASRIPVISKFVGSKYSIRAKLIIMYLLVATLPIIIISIISYTLSFQAMQKSAVDTFFTVADQLNNNIELLLLDSKNFLKIAESEQVQNYLYRTTDEATKYKNALEVVNLFKSYRSLFDFTNYIANVVILNRNGSHISEHRGVYDLPVGIDELEIVQEIQSQGDRISIIPAEKHPYMTPESNQGYLSICSVIRKNITHEELGYIIVNVQIETLHDMVDTISISPPGDFFIVEDLDNFIYPRTFAYEEGMLSSSRIEQIRTEQSGYFTESYKGVDSFFVFNTLGLTVGKIIGRSDSRNLLAGAITIRNTTFLLLAVTMTLSILMYIFISSRLTYPIRNLKQSMTLVEQGDLDLQITTVTKDEIGDLTHSFHTMVGKIKNLLDITREEQMLSKKMEFRALQAQINPHFLYNSLESILWMAEAGKKEDIITITKSLSNFYRISLSKGDYKISIRNEIAHVENYLIIQKLRYRDILSYRIEVPQVLYQYAIIKLVLQPIVENALYHGIKNRRDMGSLLITGREEPDAIVLEVSDNGMGMDADQIQGIEQMLNIPITSNTLSTSYGLRNIHQRLKLEYGEGMGIFIKSERLVGTVVSIRIAKEPYLVQSSTH
jgi:two-component system sensor histidine kinase YesM